MQISYNVTYTFRVHRDKSSRAAIHQDQTKYKQFPSRFFTARRESVLLLQCGHKSL